MAKSGWEGDAPRIDVPLLALWYSGVHPLPSSKTSAQVGRCSVKQKFLALVVPRFLSRLLLHLIVMSWVHVLDRLGTGPALAQTLNDRFATRRSGVFIAGLDTMQSAKSSG